MKLLSVDCDEQLQTGQCRWLDSNEHVIGEFDELKIPRGNDHKCVTLVVSVEEYDAMMAFMAERGIEPIIKH